jgi:hypothetical protein
MADIELFAVPAQVGPLDPNQTSAVVSDRATVPGTGYRKVWELFEPGIVAEAGPAVVLAKATHYGRIVNMDNAAAMTLTIPAGLAAGAASFYQGGAGQITFVPGGGVTLRNRLLHDKTAGQYAVITLFRQQANVWVLTGDTAL